MKTAIIDGDMVAYRCAASCEEEPLDIALERADSLIERIMYETGAGAQECYLTGSNNFRYEINPMYKADRKDKPRPKWLQDVREHLVVGWGARVSDGNEADDEMGISQCAADDSVICTNDKDLLMIPGHHFNPVTGEHRVVSPHQGMQNFYFQMIMGDPSDNIFGYDGKKRSKVPKFLEPTISMLMEMQTEQEMYDYVYDLYEQHTPDYVDYDAKTYLKINGQCLWIWRKQGDMWQEPNENAIQLLNQD